MKKDMIGFKTNNGCQVNLSQECYDSNVYLTNENDENIGSISAGDMIMLLNMYKYIKDNDIQNSFINPYGKNKEYL